MKKISLFLCLILAISASAQDRYFGQTYTSNVLPKGSFDIELWHTSRFGHAAQYFHAMDQRAEFEIGLGKNLQTAFYFNRYQQSYSDMSNEVQHNGEIGFSNEWKWRMSDQSRSKLGSALYAEWGIKGNEVELETKLILDKNFGKNLFAFNLVYELEEEAERENGKTEFETEATPVELDLAYMRQLSEAFGVGLELRNNNGLSKGKWQNSVLFAGPTINYRGDRWFIIANYLPQIRNLRKTANFPTSKVLDSHERAEARIIIGFSF